MVKSITVYHNGEGNIKTLATPPARKNTAIIKAKLSFLPFTSHVVIHAPTKVPMACAKKGKIKCFGSNICIDAFSPSVVVTSAPSGGGMIELLIVINIILTILPMTTPATIANKFLKIVFINRFLGDEIYN